MKTKRINTSGFDTLNTVGNEVIHACREIGSWGNRMRIVTSGKAVIVLPDTGSDCTTSELNKVLKVTTLTNEENTTKYVLNDGHNNNYILELSPTNKKFFDWLAKNELLDYNIDLNTLNEVDTISF